MQSDRITLTPTPFEQMLEDLHKAIQSGDEQAAASLRATIEADLSAREARLGLCRL